jgi:hypothetical protein
LEVGSPNRRFIVIAPLGMDLHALASSAIPAALQFSARQIPNQEKDPVSIEAKNSDFRFGSSQAKSYFAA